MKPALPSHIQATAQAQIAILEANSERIVQPLLGQEMVWHTTGQGPALVLLHGGHGCWLHWARVIPALSASFTLWMPDMPGFGETSLLPATDSDNALHELVKQLNSSLNALLGARTPIRLAGFSFGGLVAALLGAERSNVERMVLIGPAGHGGQRRQNTLPRPWRGLDPEAAPEPWASTLRDNLLAQMLHDPIAVDPLAIEIQWRGCMHTRFRSKPFSRSSALAPALVRYPGDVLTLWGEHDVTSTPREMPDDLKPSALRQLMIVDGAGHWLMHETPEKTAALMANGLRV